MNTQIEFVEALQSRFAVERIQDNLKVNLTQMAKPFGEAKSPGQWLRYKEPQEYLKALSDVLKSTSTDLLIVRKGGNVQYQGTWCTDYRIALRFAQWLSPEFSVAVDTLLLGMITRQYTDIKETRKLTAFNELEEKLKNRYLKPPEYEEEIDVIKSAIMASGSANKLADRIGMNAPVLSLIKNRPWLVSPENLKGIVRACRNLLARDMEPGYETYEDLLQIADPELRLRLFTKCKRIGMI